MTDGWQAYDGLVDVGYDKHFRIKKYRKEGSPRFNGVKKNFQLHLKECE